MGRFVDIFVALSFLSYCYRALEGKNIEKNLDNIVLACEVSERSKDFIGGVHMMCWVKSLSLMAEKSPVIS